MNIERQLDIILNGICQSEKNLTIEGVQNLIPGTEFGDVFHIVRPLINDGYVESYGQGYFITLKGKMFLAKGGYSGKLKKERQAIIMRWIILVASVLSVFVGAIAIFK